MMQIVNCECGESGMLEGRCVGCKRVRPSSKEVQENISKLEADMEGLLQQLHMAQKLEEEEITKTERELELEAELKEAVRLIRQGKAQFAPHTTNSDVDVFLEKHSQR